MITFDSNKLPLLTYSMNTAGTEAWCRFTTSHVNDSSPVVLDRQVVVDPTIESAICGGQTQVSGMSLTAARELAVDINVGSLPVGWRLVRSRGA